MCWWTRVGGWAGMSAVSIVLLWGCAARERPIQPVPQAEAQPPERGDPVPDGPHAAALPGIAFFGEQPELEEVPFENRLVTNLTRHTFTSEGRDFDPDLDADGQMLAFASTRNAEHPDIYVKHVDGTAMTQLTSDPADDIQPRFSPDGQRIVFCSNRSGNWDVWQINRNGTGLTQLTNDRTDEIAPCWHPSGKQIAYTVWARRGQRWEIWTLSVDEPGVRRFLAYGMFPAWSPDGRHITFQRARQRGSRWFSVWTIELADGEARHPTEVAYSDLAACIAPRWSPDGKMVVFCAVRPDGPDGQGSSPESVDADLWVVDVETGLRFKLADGGHAAFNPTWSPAGRVFFVSARSGTENIWSLTTEDEGYGIGQRQGTASPGGETETEVSIKLGGE
jgi:TolB protein